MKLAVIIVNYNVKYYLAQCLRSLQTALADIDAQVWVVDNASTDGSKAYVTQHFPQVKWIQCEENVGFARANNIAIRQSESDYVLLLNPDTIVGEGTLKQCLDFMDCHQKAGAAGVRMLHTDGSNAMESRRGVPDPWTSCYKVLGLCRRFPNNHKLAHYYMSYLPWNEPAQIEVVSGAFMLLRRQAVEQVGGLDEDFFMYGEDIDLSCRILNVGWENWYIPARILHYKGESTEKTSWRYVQNFYGAMLIFFRKHYGGLSKFLSIPVKTAIYGETFLGFLRAGWSKTRKRLGLKTQKRGDEELTTYVFVGSEKMLDRCRLLATEHHLDAVFLDLEEFKNYKEWYYLTYIIYDVSTFRYEDIFTIMTSLSNPNVRLGTYNPATGILITEKKVMI